MNNEGREMTIFEQMKKDAETIREGMRLAQQYRAAGFALVDEPLAEAARNEMAVALGGWIPAPADPTEPTQDPEPALVAQEKPDEPPAPEWPQYDPVMQQYLDSTGATWDASIHSAGKTVTASGAWRRKKGGATSDAAPAAPAEQGQDEQDPIEPSSPICAAEETGAPEPPLDPPAPEAPPTESGGTYVTLDQILSGIASAPDQATIDEWVSESLSLNLYPAGRADVDAAVTKRVRELDAPAGDTFDSIRAAIEQAIFPNEITDWLERSRHIVITQSQRIALTAVADERRRQLDAAGSAA